MRFYSKLNLKILSPIIILAIFIISLVISFLGKNLNDIGYDVILYLSIPILFHYIFNISLDMLTSVNQLSLCYGGSKVNIFLIKRASNLLLFYLISVSIPYLTYCLVNGISKESILHLLYSSLSILFMISFATIFFAIIKSSLSALTISLVYFFLFELVLSQGALREYSLYSYFKGFSQGWEIDFPLSRIMYIALTIIFFVVSIKLLSKDNNYKIGI